MTSARFSIDEINVGDAVMFDDKQHDNYGSYWTVLSKTQNQLTIEIHRSHFNDIYTIYITEVTHLEKKNLEIKIAGK